MADELVGSFKKKIATTAKTLLEQMKQEFAQSTVDLARLPKDKTDVARVIERILASNLLDWTVMPGSLSVPLIRTVVRMTKLQLGMGNNDVIDVDFVKAFLERCNGSTSSDNGADPLSLPRTRTSVAPIQLPELKKDKHLDPSRRRRLMIYRIDGNLPPIVDAPGPDSALQLLDEAFDRWTSNTRLLVQREEAPGTANVIVRSVVTDGSGGELARATLGGGPGSIQNYSFLIDSSETWTKDRFLATVCHEIGHLLGLDHSGNPADLMYPTLSAGRTATLADGDIRRAQRLWGEST